MANYALRRDAGAARHRADHRARRAEGDARGLDGGVSGTRGRGPMSERDAGASPLRRCCWARLVVRQRPRRTSRSSTAPSTSRPMRSKLWERLVNIDSGTGDADGRQCRRRHRGRGAEASSARPSKPFRRCPRVATTSSRAFRHGQRQGAADRPHGHGVREGHGGGAAVPHRRRPRLRAGRVRRQGRHRRRVVGAENSRRAEVQGLRAADA